MSENSESSVVEDVVNSMVEKLHELSPSTPSHSDEQFPAPTQYRLFNRRRSLHEILGGGRLADVLLWRQKYLSAGIFLGSTLGWLFFEKTGYTFLTIVANVLLMLMVILFLWSNATMFLHGSPPPLPDLELSEDMVTSIASLLYMVINKVLAVAHDIASGKDFKLFLKVVAVLWGLSLVGGWFHFITLVYLCTVIAHTIPAIYERYEDQIGGYTKVAVETTQKHYKKLDTVVFSKIPWTTMKDKKML